MKIVDVNGFYAGAGGGVRRYVDAKFAAAARVGFDLTVIAPGEVSRVEARDGGRVAWVEGPPMPFDPRYRLFGRREAVLAALDAAAPDLVEASSPWTSAALTAAWKGHAARVLVFHQDAVAAYGHTFLDQVLPWPAVDTLAWPFWGRVRRLSRRFDVTVAGGEWLAGRLAAHGVANARAVPFGIESGPFSPGKRDEGLRERLLARCGAPTGGRLLLAVSRFHPEKRLPTVIKAFARANSRRGDLGLVVVGEGLARRSVERASARAGHVVLLGSIEDREALAQCYASADLFVHGSAAETYGLAVAEAFASGLPAVIPDRGGAADLATRGRSVLYRTGDAADGARAILQALDGRTSPPAGAPASLDDHFDSLFALYRELTPAR
jgi:alpha-1,6-mannosyltransferase